jgi:hypothetical protein
MKRASGIVLLGLLVAIVIGWAPPLRADGEGCDAMENWYQCEAGASKGGGLLLGGGSNWGDTGAYLYECTFTGSCTNMEAGLYISGYCGRMPVYGCAGPRSCDCGPDWGTPPGFGPIRTVKRFF